MWKVVYKLSTKVFISLTLTTKVVSTISAPGIGGSENEKYLATLYGMDTRLCSLRVCLNLDIWQIDLRMQDLADWGLINDSRFRFRMISGTQFGNLAPYEWPIRNIFLHVGIYSFFYRNSYERILRITLSAVTVFLAKLSDKDIGVSCPLKYNFASF